MRRSLLAILALGAATALSAQTRPPQLTELDRSRATPDSVVLRLAERLDRDGIYIKL